MTGATIGLQAPSTGMPLCEILITSLSVDCWLQSLPALYFGVLEFYLFFYCIAYTSDHYYQLNLKKWEFDIILVDVGGRFSLVCEKLTLLKFVSSCKLLHVA